jgi:hypothetical protein
VSGIGVAGARTDTELTATKGDDLIQVIKNFINR